LAQNLPPLYLAPMAAVSHPALRLMIEKWGGCDYYYSEMISCRALVNNAPFEKWYIETDPGAEKLIYQLVGNNTEKFVEAAKILLPLNPYGIDINMGCCAPEIIKQGSGIKLMNDADKTAELIQKIKEVCRDIPLSAKIRLGEQEDEEKLIHFCLKLEKAGLDALAINPRIQKDKRARLSRWNCIPLLKEHLKIPVIGNGDIKSSEICQKKNETWKPDGLMIGQAAVSCPWIFAEIKKMSSLQNVTDINNKIQIDLKEEMYRFRELLQKYQPPEFQQSRAARFYSYFAENLFFGHRLKGKLTYCSNPDEMVKLFEDYFTLNPHEQIIYF